MRIIYADSMFLLNFTIDYLLLLATGKICALPLHRGRMALGAAWGGLYAVLAAVYPDFFSLATVKIFAGLATAAVAFGGLGRFPRTAIVFFAVSAAFGGAVYAALSLAGISASGGVLPVSTQVLVLSFALCYAAVSLVFRGMGRRAERKISTVELRLRGRSVTVRSLHDTGNELRDPVGGGRVLAAEISALSPLFPECSFTCPIDPAALCLELSALSGMAGRCRLLPCLTAADTGGILVIFRPDAVLIDGEAATHTAVALTAGPLSPDGDYRAII